MSPPRTPLVRPEAYFLRDGSASLVRGTVVVVLNWLSVVASTVALLYLVMSRSSDAPSELGRGVREVLPELSIVLLVSLVVVWVVTAGVIHVLAAGEASFGETLAVVAWGYVPDIVFAPIAVLAMYLGARDVTFDATNPETYAQDVDAFIAGTEGTVGLAIAFVGAVWGAYIWTFGIARVHGIETVRAAAIAGLVALIGFVLSL